MRLRRKPQTIVVLIEWVRLWLRLARRRTIIFGWKIDPATAKSKEGAEHCMPLELSITNEEQVKVHLTPVTTAGKPAQLDGPPTWERVSGPAKVKPADDGLSADLVSDDEDLSDTVIQVSADADLGEGVETIRDTILLHTTHANAKSLGLSRMIVRSFVADAPTLKP
jgi:hypothetical protein